MYLTWILAYLVMYCNAGIVDERR